MSILLIVLIALVGTAAGEWRRPSGTASASAPLGYEATVVGGHRMLADDPATGRAVEVLGDLGSARHIAVVVPGSGQNRRNFRESAEHPGTVPLANGQALYEEMRARKPQGDVAVVVWLGYRPPQRPDISAYRLDAAEVGAAELRRFTAGVLPPDASVTLACHSYGTAVCGLASQHEGVAENVVALASPGMGVGGAEEIRARVWAIRADDDWIRFVPAIRLGPLGLGTDPMDPGFGAARFADPSIAGHDDYYRRGSASLSAIARIALGRVGTLKQWLG